MIIADDEMQHASAKISPDRPAPSACNVHVDDRLSRMEFLIEQLIDKAETNSTQTAYQVEKPQYQISSSLSQQPPLAVSFILFCHPFTFFLLTFQI